MPRLYITWYAEPEDPHYWRFFRVGGITVSLKSLLKMPRWKFTRVLSQGFRRFFNYDGPLLVDSMLTEVHAPRSNMHGDIPQSHVLYLQYLLGSDILIQRDYPLIHVDDPGLRTKLFNRNLAMAEAALRFGDLVGKDVMLVVHGWNLNTYIKCAEYYRDLGVKYVGIGSLVPHRSNTKFLINVVKGVREVLGSHVHMHLFGISTIELITQLGNYVDSVDVSTPAIAGAKKELIVWDGSRLIRVKTTTVTGIKIMSELIERSSDELERKLLLGILNARSLRDKNLHTMIYNAYIITKYWNSVIDKQ
ncbi:hypothetical protein [Vulcanisaeta distributa]|uniref:tRNA-guanine(15) transglycosylase-like domain-containing protein n=1 Tax=Vulcanisaeta distributa (strain DSM 14429 / JCM 11212 / NBRC 100878 / IC-017) TaxID=572478 RepID=E1QST2_VULDI|nr:hypothetical protein [Vulcanisaeta distributa]ADN49599.1 hypothetical protein Vdis_0186 [Vulcanisaeta distributa DSM 14429]